MTFYVPHERVALDCGDELITKQSSKDECDINYILSNYERTGLLPSSLGQGEFLDLPSSLDYQTFLEEVRIAQEGFASLPSSVREAFRNDPGLFLAALDDPSQHQRLRELGVLRDPTPADVAGGAQPDVPAAGS